MRAIVCGVFAFAGLVGCGGKDGATDGGGAAGDACCDPVPGFLDERLPPPGTWESAGVEGGIPERPTICATVSADTTGATSAVAAIQAALDACPDGQTVMVPAGRYLIDDRITVPSNVTLRGVGATTVFLSATDNPIRIGGGFPWPPPKANDPYNAPITGGATRGSTQVTTSATVDAEVGDLVMIDEQDDAELVWTKGDAPGRYRGSMHRVESIAGTTVTFRPQLPITFTRSPQLSWYGAPAHDAGVEAIKFEGMGSQPGNFINIDGAWNVWVKDCEFSNMPSKTLLIAWANHVEIRGNYLHDQSNGGPNSEGIDLLADVNWSLVIDNICIAAGFPQINIGDAGANPYYSGGFGNVIAYNYAVDSYYTDPPTASDAGKMTADISTNHSPHTMYNLIEGNVIGKFGVDAYHGSGSHTVLLRNRILGTSRWQGFSTRTTIEIDRRNLHYALVGNVLGSVAGAAQDYVTTSGFSGTAIYRLGYPDVGNDGFSGTFPPTPLTHGDGGPRDLYVDRDTRPPGTTLIEGNWDAKTRMVDWSRPREPLPASLFLPGKPAWFGSLAWPPVDAEGTPSDDPAIIPAAYRYTNGRDP